MTNVAILWHMHQPYYEDLATGEHMLPWVRMHGLKDYYGMVALLREFPQMKLTFNLVPSLLVQLEAFAEERARDWHLELGVKPAHELSEHDRVTALSEFFHAPRRMIDQYPRYAELLQKRESGGGYTDQDFLDLQVWHKLAWVDPFYLDADERVRRLIEKQRGFNESDKAELRQVELEILRRVIPEYRDAAARGQAELSTSPFYHPILPLLCDTDIYLRTHPSSGVPRPAFRHPEDAAEQLRRARQCHKRLFGRHPEGLWPSEGSVSDEAAALAARAGFKWMATDEAILGRSLGRDFRRDAHGRLEEPGALYRAYKLQTGGTEPIACLFRDHSLSDLIGFVYAGWQTEAAAFDFIGRLAEAGRRFSEATSGEEATISVILDGENAWEHFEGGGRPFLRAVYRLLSSHQELRPVTMTEAAARPSRTLNSIFPGSWIDGNFFIWIGHGDDLRAWRQLRDARQMFGRVSVAASADDREQAFQELLIAEGSDWFWWYGDDHSSEHDLEFDELFRRHLRNVYQALSQPIPEELFGTNISTSQVPVSVTPPVGLISPVLDGRASSYFEWLPAGVVETDVPSGTMTGGEHRDPEVRTLLFGFDLRCLYLRLDLSGPAGQRLTQGLHFGVSFAIPPDYRMLILGTAQGPSAALQERGADGVWHRVAHASPKVAAGEILEAVIPFADLGLRPNAPFAFFVTVHNGMQELERHPAHRPISSVVPEQASEDLNWNA